MARVAPPGDRQRRSRGLEREPARQRPGDRVEPATTSRMYRIGRIAGWLIVALALAFLGVELWQSQPGRLVADHAAAIALALIVGAPVYGLAGLLLAEAWRELLGPQADVDPWHHRSLYGRTQIAKYLPGNCFHFVGRQIAGRRLGHGHGALAFASLAETASLLAIAGTLAAPWLGALAARLPGASGACAVVAASGTLLLIALNRRRLRRWRIAAAPWTGAPAAAWSGRVVKAAALHALFFALAGLILWQLAAGLAATAASAPGPAAAISLLALAWCAGFVVPGSAAGIGVREALLVLALEPHLVSGGAMVVAVALRLVTTAGDLLLFGWCAVVWPERVAGARATSG
jgi:hypothetical protein